MKKSKLMAAFLAAALCAPQAAYAARDGDGMQYTSASEGFYGSIRTLYSSNTGDKRNGGRISADFSRLGVQGSLDLGHGLTGLYRYEWLIDGENGDPVGTTRLSYVGLRGGFGEFTAGSHWAQDYNWVTTKTDIASGSGDFVPTGRVKNSFQYTTPDANGFQAAFRVRMDGEGENDGASSSIVSGNLAEANVVAIATIPMTTGRNGSNMLTETTVSVTPSVNSLRINGLGTSRDISSEIPGLNINVSVTPVVLPEGTAIPAAVSIAVTTTVPLAVAINGTGASKGSETVDEWALAAKYSTHGFTFGAAYQVAPDRRGFAAPLNNNMLAVGNGALTESGGSRTVNNSVTVAVTVSGVMLTNTVAFNTTLPATANVALSPVDEDHTFWALHAGYGQNNWNINGWYGKENTADRGIDAADASNAAAQAKGLRPEDTTIYSISGDVAMGKFALVGIYDTRDNKWGQDDSYFIAQVDYKFTSNSKAYFAYIARDFESDPNKDDEVRIGLRMDF